MNCPRCQGPDFQALSFVYQNGLSFTSGTTTGVGFAGAGVGVFGAKTKGTSTTALAMQAAPPAKRKFGAQAFFLFVSLLMASTYPAAWIGVALFGFAIYNSVKWNKIDWVALYNTWLQQFMCLRCGTIVTALQAQPPARAPLSVTPAPTLSGGDAQILPTQ